MSGTVWRTYIPRGWHIHWCMLTFSNSSALLHVFGAVCGFINIHVEEQLWEPLSACGVLCCLAHATFNVSSSAPTLAAH